MWFRAIFEMPSPSTQILKESHNLGFEFSTHKTMTSLGLKEQNQVHWTRPTHTMFNLSVLMMQWAVSRRCQTLLTWQTAAYKSFEMTYDTPQIAKSPTASQPMEVPAQNWFHQATHVVQQLPLEVISWLRLTVSIISMFAGSWRLFDSDRRLAKAPQFL